MSYENIDPRVTEAVFKHVDTHDLDFDRNIKQLYTDIVTAVAPSSLQRSKMYWKHCIQTELNEVFEHLHIKHWKKDANQKTSDEIFFEVADVATFMLLFNLVCGKEVPHMWMGYEDEMKTMHEYDPKDPTLCVTITRMSGDIERPGYQTVILLTLMYMAGMTVDDLLRACAIKIGLVGIRLKDDSYKKGWKNTNSDGYRVNTLCTRLFNMKDITPAGAFEILVSRANEFIEEDGA